jgi:septum formation protein
MSEMKTVILASASPRRKEILEKTGLKFKVDAGEYEEDMEIHAEPHRLARRLSCEKAKAVAHRYKDALIIAADTFVVFKGRMLGKPHTSEEARTMLRNLSGKMHSVITGFTVMDVSTNKKKSGSAETKVYFKRLTTREIEAYIKTKEPLDKAGAYAIQGLGALFVKRIEGDYFNVVGLPLYEVTKCLKRFGVYAL